MKKYILSAVLLSILFSTGYSQDKIITLKGDTIDCKINKVSNSNVFFDVVVKGVRSSGKLPLDSLLNYSISVKTNTTERKREKVDPFERLRLGFTGGFGYLLSSSQEAEVTLIDYGLDPPEVHSYYSDLKSGFNANADVTFMFAPRYGAGLKYKFFDTSASTEGFFDPEDGINLIYTTFSEQIYVNFIGCSFFYQEPIGFQNSFRVNFSSSIGLATYRNEAEYLSGYLLLTSKNFGMDAGIGCEYFFTRNLSVAADLSVFYASFKKMKVSDGVNTTTLELEKENYEDLSRLDISLGIRFYLFNR